MELESISTEYMMANEVSRLDTIVSGYMSSDIGSSSSPHAEISENCDDCTEYIPVACDYYAYDNLTDEFVFSFAFECFQLSRTATFFVHKLLQQKNSPL